MNLIPANKDPSSTSLSRRTWLTTLSRSLILSGTQVLSGGTFGRRAALWPQTDRPLRVDESSAKVVPGTPGSTEDAITPVGQFYLRNHHEEPQLTLASWKLKIEGKVARPLQLTFSDLLEAPVTKLEAVLECAGNGATTGVLVACGYWEGASLSHFLKQAAPEPNADRIMLVGSDQGRLLEGETSYPYARIVSLEQGLSPEAMVAFRLNDQFLPRRHGFPARALFPGLYAMNSVKWLERVVVLGPQDWPAAFYSSGMDLLYVRTFNDPAASSGTNRVSDVLIKSQIVSPAPGARIAAGPHAIWGFAWAGKHTVRSVQTSVDGGKHWQEAALQGASRPFGWVKWSFAWQASRGEHALMCRAQDSAGNWQPLERDPNRRDGYELNWCAPVNCSAR